MASLEEKIRVSNAHGTRNTMTDYGNRRFYDIDEYEEQRDRIKTKLARIRRKFECACQCGQPDAAFVLAIDLNYWSVKLAKLTKGY